jgi:hypothetical protein
MGHTIGACQVSFFTSLDEEVQKELTAAMFRAMPEMTSFEAELMGYCNAQAAPSDFSVSHKPDTITEPSTDHQDGVVRVPQVNHRDVQSRAGVRPFSHRHTYAGL